MKNNGVIPSLLGTNNTAPESHSRPDHSDVQKPIGHIRPDTEHTPYKNLECLTWRANRSMRQS